MGRALLAIIYKEFVHFRRNPAVLRRVLLSQAINVLLLAWLDVIVHDMPAVIVDQDHTVESHEVIERIAATKTFDLKYATSSVDQARDHIRAGRARAAIVIPPGYGRARAEREPGRLLALVDGSDPVASAQAQGAVTGVATQMNIEAQEERVGGGQSFTTHDVLLFNPEGRTANFMLPALLVVSLGIVLSMGAIRTLVSERTGGYLERILMTPVPYWTFIAGKLVPWFVLGLINSVGFLVVARWGFAVPIRGSLALLVGTTALYVATILAIGAWIASGARTMREAQNIWGLWNFPTVFLTGYVFPLSSLPKWLLPISYALPQTHFIEVMRGVCLRGATARELAVEIAYLTVMPIVVTILAAIRFARSLEAG